MALLRVLTNNADVDDESEVIDNDDVGVVLIMVAGNCKLPPTSASPECKRLLETTGDSLKLIEF